MNNLIDEGIDFLEIVTEGVSYIFAGIALGFFTIVFVPFGIASRITKKIRRKVKT